METITRNVVSTSINTQQTPTIWRRMPITYVIGLTISIVLGLLTKKNNNLNPDPVTFKGLPERNTAPNSAIISPPDLSDS
jgi:hypothetical protein